MTVQASAPGTAPTTAVTAATATATTRTTAAWATARPATGGPPRRQPAGGRAVIGIAVGRVLLMLAALMLGFAGYLLAVSGLQQTRTQDNLYKTFRGQLAQTGDEVAPVAPPITPGVPVAIVEIPRLKVRQVVVEGTTSGALTRGLGHRRDTPLPGQAGTAVVYGRRSTFGAPFAKLDKLRIGDEIVATTGLGSATFTVVEVRDGRTPPRPLTAPVNRITLVTSAPAVSPSHTLVVTAKLTTAVAPSAGVRPAIYADERSLASEPAAALPLLLWAQVLLVAVVCATWLFHRWERWPAYLVSAPVLVAVVWNVYENLARLLPNLL
ncbi:sortase [Frankia sp. Cj3]|uniref:sortase n=1 Tax=Frankia sp. Cj3 TaxID=2880976 RepID=UPI001EF4912E|nr:sortase [Frankia sp. Cj3]